MGGKRNYTDDELTLIASLAALGLRLRDIAKATGRSATGSGISNLIHSGRLPIVVADKIKPGDEQRRPWQPAEDTVVDILTREGWKAAQIASLLSRTEGAVETQKVRRGIFGPRHPTKQKPSSSWRPCMCCQKTFRSEWIGNRLCYECKSNEGDTSDFYRS